MRPDAALTMADIPREVPSLAGKAFLQYRRSGNKKHTVLPDFLVGAHAAVQQWPLLTHDVSRYRTYFPAMTLIAPA